MKVGGRLELLSQENCFRSAPLSAENYDGVTSIVKRDENIDLRGNAVE